MGSRRAVRLVAALVAVLAVAGGTAAPRVHSAFSAAARTGAAFRAASIFAPRSLAPPAVSGDPVVGGRLSASAGSWAREPTAYAYRWLRCDGSGDGCAAIDGATDAAYTPVAADRGARLRVRVTATNAGGETAATSEPTAPVGDGGPVNTTAPTIAGTVDVGQLLTADPGRWTGATADPIYGWLRCDRDGAPCQPISGATASTYRVTTLDSGSSFRVSVTQSGPGGSASATSAPTTALRALTLERWFNGSSHWISATAPPAGFSLEWALGYLPSASSATGATVVIYGCRLVDGTHMVSRDPGCERNVQVERIGVVFDPGRPQPAGTLPLYRCYRWNGLYDHWASNSSACDGFQNEQLLGYVLQAATGRARTRRDGPGATGARPAAAGLSR